MKNNDFFGDRLGIFVTAVAVLLIIAMLMLAVGCTRKVYVPEERVTVRTDTVYSRSEALRVDTIWRVSDSSLIVRDSVAVRLDSQNRVAGYDYYHFRDLRKTDDTRLVSLQTMIDSLRRIRADSVAVREPYAVETIREVNRLRWWQKILMGCGVLSILFITITIVRRYRRKNS